MNKKNRDEIKVNIIDVNEVPEFIFPYFTSYKMHIDSQIDVYGFFIESQLIAVSAIIPDDPNYGHGFITDGNPIIYVFEVREDMRGKGYGRKCAKILLDNVIEEDKIQLSCTMLVVDFWQKLGFEIKFIDKATYMYKMLLEKKKENKIIE